MPELPEVEITRRHLESAIVGRRFESVAVTHVRSARLNASPSELEARLTGLKVLSLGRHGKFLVGALEDGFSLLAHLGMSGRFSLDPGHVPRAPHTHVVARMDDGIELRFVDPRTFGFIAVLDEDEMDRSPLTRLGPDAWITPLSPEELVSRLNGRSASIKALLLDQRPIAGLGNIYADEVLFGAGIHPSKPGGQIGLDRSASMLAAIDRVLASAIDSGGTTLDDLAYLLPDGTAGENLDRLAVYGRTGMPCPTCATPVEKVVIRARSTHFCPMCQT